MPKICAVCGKKPSFGNSRSHSMVATKRRFDPNLQRVRVNLGGKAQRVIATNAFPTGWEDWGPDPSWPAPTLPSR